jgi:SAM-dependent methyltransferase
MSGLRPSTHTTRAETTHAAGVASAPTTGTPGARGVSAMLRRLYEATWGRLVARTYDRFMAATEKAGLIERRRELLAHASGRCLEVGAGTGVNLELWPRSVEGLVLSEPDRHMSAQLRKHVERSRNAVQVVEAPGERLPFEDASFDTVALTLVLCTAPDPAAVLREVRRVLKPGGRMLFLEHVRSEDVRLALAGPAPWAVVRVRVRLPLQPRHARHDHCIRVGRRKRRPRRAAEVPTDRQTDDLGRRAPRRLTTAVTGSLAARRQPATATPNVASSPSARRGPLAFDETRDLKRRSDRDPDQARHEAGPTLTHGS